MEQLDLFSSPQPKPVVPGIPGLEYRAEFVTATQEVELLAEVDERPWLTDLKRRVQHYGYRYDYRSRTILRSMRVGPLPDFAVALGLQLVNAGLLRETPDQVIVNEYTPGQGIAPHVDCITCFMDRVVTVSLGSPCEFELIRGERTHTVLAERRSAILLSGEARYDWMHTIRPRKSDYGVQRARRVSLTFRSVILAG